MPQDDIGAHLKSLRLKAGYESLGSLSRASGVTVATLSRIESGGQKPNPETLEKLAPFLKVSHEELMTEAGYLKPLSGKSKLKTSNLQGRTDNITHTNNLTPKEERDIARDLDRILSD
ncbi:MAG: helix-turn-helix transcriptional regulator, partial [Desulfosporosinus sp.]|nr:helix-turn-helix transcriptional regulator [Desulfosporosinus sp.]